MTSIYCIRFYDSFKKKISKLKLFTDQSFIFFNRIFFFHFLHLFALFKVSYYFFNRILNIIKL